MESKNGKKIVDILFYLLYYFTLILAITYELSIIYENVFPNYFDWIKFGEGMLFCVLSVFIIKNNKKASSFFLLLTFFIQMVPLSACYAVCGGSKLYYWICNLGFFVCVYITQYVKLHRKKIVIDINRKWIYTICVIVVAIVIVSIYRNNGLPSLIALDIYKVYQLRSSGAFYMHKYVGYLFKICIYVVLPMLMTRSIIQKNYFISFVYLGIIVVLYLYSGHKVILFSIPLILGSLYFATRKDTNDNFVYFGTIGMSVLSLCGVICSQSNLFYKVFSLIIRRVILLPARIKLCYSDYFQSNPKYGFYGLIPKIVVDSKYEGVVIGNVIGKLYFEQNTNSSTGFLGEAFMHFGLVGVIAGWIIIAMILKGFDRIENLEGKVFTLGSFSMFVYYLNDGLLFGSLIAGPAMAVILISIYIIFSKRERQLLISKNINKHERLK